MILSRANEAFDAEMESRVLSAENDYLKSKTKPPMSDSELADLNKPENRDRKEALLKQIGANDKDNQAKTTSRTTDEKKAYGEIGDGFRNLGTMFGVGGRASGESGFVDADGKFHPRTCFVKGTLVYTATGLKPIEEIVVGEMVLSWNEKTGKNEYKKVKELFHNKVDVLVKVKIDEKNFIETTLGHPFYVVRQEKENQSTKFSGGWLEAKDLKSGDKLLNEKGEIVNVKEIIFEVQEELVEVFNFEVEDFHTYYVSNKKVLVHNLCLPVIVAGAAVGFRACMNNPTCRTQSAIITAEIGMGLYKAGEVAVDYYKKNRKDNAQEITIVTPPDIVPFKPEDPKKPATTVTVPHKEPHKPTPPSYFPNKNGSDVTPARIKTVATQSTDIVTNSRPVNETNTGNEITPTRPGFFSETWQGITNGFGNARRFISDAGTAFVNGLGRVGNYVSSSFDRIRERVSSVFQPNQTRMSTGSIKDDDEKKIQLSLKETQKKKQEELSRNADNKKPQQEQQQQGFFDYIKKRNGHLSGNVHPVTKVTFDNDGFPDFSNFLYQSGPNQVYIYPSGDRIRDNEAANHAAGYDFTPEGYVWHHHQDFGKMQLVDEKIHKQTGHTGGFSLW